MLIYIAFTFSFAKNIYYGIDLKKNKSELDYLLTFRIKSISLKI